ncbi:dTMP kinase [Cohnella massiliensis]|uniref:dTMP kinase n=1 Tax=Cohnella massiliensis TaxID=1816691 RepID=UPI001118ED88|nr:dTMP kinase [Cohnella massiliensis]
MTNGLLIAICGLDGAGKTTQIQLLDRWFKQNGERTLVTRQPTDYYRKDPRVRDYLDDGKCPDIKAIALLSAADRLWQMSAEIEPALREGVHVISDRYIFSSYSVFLARGLDYSYLQRLYGDIRMPDLTVFLDLEPEVSLQRVMSRDGKENMKYEERGSETFKKIRSNFYAVLPQDSLIVDASKRPEEIHSEIAQRLGQIREAGVMQR